MHHLRSQPLVGSKGSASQKKKVYEELAEASHQHRQIEMVSLKCLPGPPARPREIAELLEFDDIVGLAVGMEVELLPAAVKRNCL
jgi:hypothetical protein